MYKIFFKKMLYYLIIFIFLLMFCSSSFAVLSKEKISDANKLNWFSYNKGLTKSKVENIPILIYFYSDNCSYCRKLETETFANKEIVEIMNKYFALIKINSNSSNIVLENEKKISERALSSEIYQVRGYPTVWFLGKNQDRLASLPGFVEPAVFRNILENVLDYIEGSHYKELSFPEYYNTRNQ